MVSLKDLVTCWQIIINKIFKHLDFFEIESN